MDSQRIIQSIPNEFTYALIALVVAVAIVCIYYCVSGEQFRPYMLSNGLMANTPLEAVIDAEYNGENYRIPPLIRRPEYVIKSGGLLPPGSVDPSMYGRTDYRIIGAKRCGNCSGCRQGSGCIRDCSRCGVIPTDDLLYEAMGIPARLPKDFRPCEQCTFINKVGYMYKQ